MTLVGDGVPMADNPLDPEDGARHLARARRRQQRVDAALEHARARTPGLVAAPGPNLQALQVQAQQLQARCGSDRDCLVREAAGLGALQMAARGGPDGGAPSAAGRLQADAADAAAEDGDAGRVDVRSLLFRAVAGCDPTGRVQIDECTTGSHADAQARVAATQARHGDDRAVVAAQPCGMQAVVLDTRSGRLWARNPLADLRPQGVTVRSESNRRPRRSEGPLALDWHEAAAWLQERLQHLDEAGSAETTQRAGSDARTRVQRRRHWQRL